MLIASITELKPVHYTVAFPNTSFPANGPSDAFLASHGYAKVNMFRPHSASEKLVPATPVYENGWVYTVAVVPKTADDWAAEEASQWANIRAQRNRMIAACDWTQLSDSPLTAEKRAEWAAYRQALRDITNQADPFNIVWPDDPNVVKNEVG